MTWKQDALYKQKQKQYADKHLKGCVEPELKSGDIVLIKQKKQQQIVIKF